MIRRRRTPEPIEGTEAELVAMTAELDEAHRDSLPQLRAVLTEWRETNASRRAFLIGSGAVVGGVALVASGAGGIAQAAASSMGKSSSGTSAVLTATKGQKLTGDLAIVALAASLENLAVGTYQAGIDAATAGKLGAVPPAVVSFATTAQSQHKDHAAAWNSVLTGAGKKAITGVDLTVKKDVDTAFASVKDVPGLAMLALSLENGAAATYLSAIDAVKSPAGIKVAATIQPGRDAARCRAELPARPVPGARQLLEEGRRPHHHRQDRLRPQGIGLRASGGFEPPHTAPEADALSPELRGRGVEDTRAKSWEPGRVSGWTSDERAEELRPTAETP